MVSIHLDIIKFLLIYRYLQNTYWFKREEPLTREEQLVKEIENLRKALAYSELRNEALHEVLKIGKEQYGLDLLKKAGAKQ